MAWYLRPEDIDSIHAGVLARSPKKSDRKYPGYAGGGANSIRFIVETCRPADDAPESVVQSAACLATRINLGHPYSTANKRTALLSAATVLRENGLALVASNEEADRFMRELRLRSLPQSAVADWLRHHSRKV